MSDAASTVKISQLKGSETVPLGLKVPVGKSLRPAVQKIVRELAPEKIVLFGSYAYGKPNQHSDVDLLVIMETDQSNKDRSWAVSRLLLPRPFPVDILVRTPKEVEEALASGDFFIKEIRLYRFRREKYRKIECERAYARSHSIFRIPYPVKTVKPEILTRGVVLYERSE